MKGKKIYAAVIAFLAMSLVNADCPGTCEYEGMVVQSGSPNSGTNNKNSNNNGQYGDEPMMGQDGCSNLSQAEQTFSAQLNDSNAMMFCSKMTPAQRQKAMQMTGTRGPSGVKMTPDDAVQNVMKNSGIPTGSKQRGASACPVQ